MLYLSIFELVNWHTVSDVWSENVSILSNFVKIFLSCHFALSIFLLTHYLFFVVLIIVYYC
jgi:hypothetical protein